MFTVTVKGIDGVQKWLEKAAAGLERVPERFSKREDVKQKLRTIAQMSLDTVGISDSGTSKENMQVESIPGGIAVFEALNAATAPIAARVPITDSYVLFFLTEYARYSFSHEGLSKSVPKDFLRLWPEAMKPTVVDAIEQEVQEAIKER